MITVSELFEFLVNEKGIKLTSEQESKLLVACERAILENQDDFSRQVAGMAYLNVILDFPNMTL